MSQKIVADIVVVGGGIAGLWLSARLRQLGYATLLIENNTLGGGQSVKSQGIIHGGTKYALNGVLTGASEAISGMPQRWRDCLEGNGELDLRGAKVLSAHHYLWSPGSLAGNLMSFFASKAIRARVKQVKKDELPPALQSEHFKGKAYQLNELVFDVPSVVACLANLLEGSILKANAVSLVSKSAHNVTITADNVEIEAQRVIFSAGEGNESLIKAFNFSQPVMQRRPLHMVMVKSPNIKPLYAHCLGSGVKPRVTITTHYHQDGTPVWYIGGDLAEADGVARTPEEQISFAKKELEKVIPWVDLTDAAWATLRVNRAEPAQNNLMRPDTAFISQNNAIMIGWPTKLALAPDFADQCIELLKNEGVEPSHKEICTDLPKPEVAKTPWDESFA